MDKGAMESKKPKWRAIGVNDARMVKTLTALRTGLLALIERKPFDKITTRDIVVESGVSNATFYRHYVDKAALLDAVAANEINRLVEMAPLALSTGVTRDASIALCTYVHENRALWSALLTGGAAGALREEFVRIATGIATTTQTTSSWVPVDLGVIHGVDATVGILSWWLRQPEEIPVEKVADFIWRLVVVPTMAEP